jgi:hypothetical protein
MRHYAPRQREKDKRWDYSVRNDDLIQAIGYCSAYYEWTDDLLVHIGVPKDHPELVKRRNFKSKHHTCGHSTPEEAQKCYREFLLDQRLSLNKKHDNMQKKCDVCDKWTDLFAEVGSESWNLCEDHNNREEIEKLFKIPNESWIS